MAEISDEWLRAAFPGGGLEWTSQPGPECPTPGQLWSTLRRELPDDERRAVVEHLASCPSCAEAWRLAVAVAREEAPGLSVAPPRRSAVSGPRRGFVLLLAAATMVLALGAIWRWRVPQLPAPPGFREASDPAVHSLLPEGKVLPRDACQLRWSAGPPGSRYDLRVTTESLQVVVTAQGLSEPSHRVPEAALALLAPGSRLLWRVEVLLPDGHRVDSPTFLTSCDRSGEPPRSA
jgi:putative zinc finger protein